MRNLTMLTDLYQMTMMYGYINARHLTDRIAVFDMFYRQNPGGSALCRRGGLGAGDRLHQKPALSTRRTSSICARLNLFDERFLDYLEDFHFTGEHLCRAGGHRWSSPTSR